MSGKARALVSALEELSALDRGARSFKRSLTYFTATDKRGEERLKKAKPKKPRVKRKPRAERKRSPGRVTPVATIEGRLPVEEAQESRERVYLRFGEPPESGVSQNMMTRAYEAGVSCFWGWRIRNHKGDISYALDVPTEQLMFEMTGQATTMVDMVLEGRDVYVLEGGEEVGRGGDSEPVLAGATPKLISPFCRVDLPEWFGEEGRAVAERWNRARRTPKLRRSPEGRQQALRSLLGAGTRLAATVVENARKIVEERGVSAEELAKVAERQREFEAASESTKRRIMPLNTKAARVVREEGPRFRVIDPLDFEAQERRTRRALGLEEEQVEPVSGEGVPLVERVLDRATAAARNSKVHGPEHWKRVAVAGLELCKEVPGADPPVVLRFALLHDSQRYNDHHDPGHGRRGGALARELLAQDETLSSDQVDLIAHDCDLHTAGHVSSDPTVGVCWDADRLNYWRVNCRPSPTLLSTEAARSLERIEWARELQTEPCMWPEIFESYRDFDLKREESVSA